MALSELPINPRIEVQELMKRIPFCDVRRKGDQSILFGGFRNQDEGVDFTIVNPDEAEELLVPLEETWPSQFSEDTPSSELWFNGVLLREHFRRNPYNDMFLLPCAHAPGTPDYAFAFSASYRSGERTTPLGAAVAMWNKLSPEKIAIPAFAIKPSARKQGIGKWLFRYMTTLFQLSATGMRIECDTNENSSQVSGGWSPVPAWEAWGMQQYGRLPHYGTNDPGVGDGITFFGNIDEMEQSWVQRDPQFLIWRKYMQAMLR